MNKEIYKLLGKKTLFDGEFSTRFVHIHRSGIFYILLANLLLWSCSDKAKQPDPVNQVIRSMSDTLPKVSLPEDADPHNEDWKGIDLSPKKPILPLYAEEEAKKLHLPPGYDITPILTEPQIDQPGAIAFDGNGRMYVLELRSYMLTADSDGTLEPVSRISRWEDKDNDGIYETGTPFIDHLIFPRFVLPYGKDCILTMESDADNVYKYTDTDGDGKADKKELFTNHYGRSGNVEHQQAFMHWGMDNWLYSTVNAFRVRETPNGIVRERTGYNRAQWGVAHDNDGKVWFQGGASGLPSYFEFPIHYGNFKVKNEYAEGFEIPWGEPLGTEDVQGGMDQVRRPDGSLNKVTGAAGNDVFRGDRLPKSLEGQYFYGEPVARIVRQVNPVVTEGLTTLHNAYQNQKSEFLRSSDPLFRPVDMATAPDGTLYIVDMYHGIIQEGQWAQKGTYLRTKIEQYQLDKVIGLGRIWRITYDGMERNRTKPNMLGETPAQLVKHLEHPNGWWRDKAQQLIVLHRDKSVVPQLKTMVRKSNYLLARFHALWSLEGLDALDPELIRELFKDPEPRMRIQALRASETLYKAGDKSLATDYLKLMEGPDTDVVIQAMLTSQLLEIPFFDEHLQSLMDKNEAKGIQVVGQQILERPKTKEVETPYGQSLTEEEKSRLKRGKVIFNELCAQCHGSDGTGTQVGNGLTMAPPLAGSLRVQGQKEYVTKVLLHGLEGPIEDKTYPGSIMVGMGDQSDDWIASILSYIRLNLDNNATIVTPADVAQIRNSSTAQKQVYRYPELRASTPQQFVPTEEWKITASHNAPTRVGGKTSPTSAFNFEGWSTGVMQQKGMWFQIELPQPVVLAELDFYSKPITRGRNPDSPPPIQTYPRDYVVSVSHDGKVWKVISQKEGKRPLSSIFLNRVEAKFIKIELSKGLNENLEIPWSMQQVKLYGMKK